MCARGGIRGVEPQPQKSEISPAAVWQLGLIF
nr:MAG TPA: hypothetical protein [Caudoviricetes sp.]